MNRFDVDFETVWCWVAVVAAVVAGLCALFVFFEEKKITGYYLSQPDRSTGYCVVADITWMLDRTAFCSDDINKTLDVLNKSNASLVKR